MNPYQSSLPLFTCQGHTLFRLSPHVRWLTAFSRVTRVTCVTRHWFPRMCSRSFKFYQIIDGRHIMVFIGRHVVRIFRCQWLVSPGISDFHVMLVTRGAPFDDPDQLPVLINKYLARILVLILVGIHWESLSVSPCHLTRVHAAKWTLNFERIETGEPMY